MSNWIEKKTIVGLAGSDAAINAVKEELKLHGKELTKAEVMDLHAGISLLIRQKVHSKFVPKTHMDL
jgi:hypothetical protein